MYGKGSKKKYKSIQKKKKSKNSKKNKGGFSTTYGPYLSLQNDTSAYSRLGAGGKCCKPYWQFVHETPFSYGKGGKTNKKNKKKNIKMGGNNCTVNANQISTKCNANSNSTCIPNVNVSQYKCPCAFLPLDGPKQNIYPLSNNPPTGPPYAFNGGKKNNKK